MQLRNLIWSQLDQLKGDMHALPPAVGQLVSDLDEVLLAVAEEFARRYDRIELSDPADAQVDRPQLCDDLADIERTIGESLIPIIKGARSASVPVEFEGFMEDLARAFTGDQTTAILSSHDAYQYSVTQLGSTAKLAQMMGAGGVDGPASRRFVALSVPVLMRDSATLHAVLMSHELGHLAEWRFGLSGKLGRPPRPGAYAKDGEPGADAAAALYVRVASSWAVELAADAVAALCLGPAAVLATFELNSAIGRFDVDSLTHPAGDRRVAFMLRVLAESGYDLKVSDGPDLVTADADDAGQSEATRPIPAQLQTSLAQCVREVEGAWNRDLALRGLYAERGDAYTAFQEGPARLAWDWVRDRALSLVPIAQKDVSKFAFQVAWLDQINEAAVELASGSPCVPADLPGGPPWSDALVILNAAWQVRASEEAMAQLAMMLGYSDADVEGHAHAANSLDQLVLKSLEVSQQRRKDNAA